MVITKTFLHQNKKALKSSDLLIKESKIFDAKDFNYFNDVEEDIIQGFVINSSEKLSLEDIIVIKLTR